MCKPVSFYVDSGKSLSDLLAELYHQPYLWNGILKAQDAIQNQNPGIGSRINESEDSSAAWWSDELNRCLWTLLDHFLVCLASAWEPCNFGKVDNLGTPLTGANEIFDEGGNETLKSVGSRERLEHWGKHRFLETSAFLLITVTIPRMTLGHQYMRFPWTLFQPGCQGIKKEQTLLEIRGSSSRELTGRVSP